MINADTTSVAGREATEDIFAIVIEIMVALSKVQIYAKDFDYEEFRNYLNELGDFPRCQWWWIVKVHVHTKKDPGYA